MNRQEHPLFGQRVEIHVSVWKQAVRAAVALAIASGLWTLFLRGRELGEADAYVFLPIVAFSIWVLLRALNQLIRSGPRMVISPAGFFDRTLGVTLPWDAVWCSEVDFPLFPRMLELHLDDDAAWLPRVSTWKRVTYRLRVHGTLGLVVGLGGLRMAPDAIMALIDAYEGAIARRSRCERTTTGFRDRWLALPWHRRQWEKWKWPNVFGRRGLIPFVGALCLGLTIWSAVDLVLPNVELDRIEGRLTGWERLRQNRIALHLATPNGDRRVISHFGIPRPDAFVRDLQIGARVIVRGRSDFFNFRFRELTVGDHIVIAAEQAAAAERREDGFVLGLGLSLFALFAGFVEYLWRWKLRHPDSTP